MDPLQALQQELKRKELGAQPSVHDGVQPAGGKQSRFNIKNRALLIKASAISVLIIFALFACLILIFSRPPAGFPVGKYVEIQSGTFDDVGQLLESKQIIRSAFWFKIVARLTGNTLLKTGLYSFEKPFYAFTIARRINDGFTNVERVRITVPEGMTVAQTAAIAYKALGADFSQKRFISLAKANEGYLFPETYFVLPNISEDELVTTMLDMYKLRTKNLKQDIARSGRTERDIVIMASILEEEGNTTNSRQMISDILWRRIKIGMPLQVDATFLYINGKKTHELTREDLRDTSPYNTYMYKGLPPGPITNPGLDSIQAALNPIKNEYWYYLSDKEGGMHYAETYNEHLANKAKYIR